MENEFKSWFVHNVAATYDGYVAERDRNTSGRFQHKRAAIAASLALYHLREHLPKQITASRKKIEQICPEYALIADVANAAKHRKLDFGRPTISDVSSIKEAHVVVQYVGDDPSYINSFTSVRVKNEDGNQVDLDNTITSVYNFWVSYLADNAFDRFRLREFRPDFGRIFVAREDARHPKLEAMRGIDWLTEFEMRRFNVSTGKPEECDMTGADLQMRIYLPVYKLDITVSIPNYDDRIITIDLTSEESLEYARLRTDAEFQSFQRYILVQHAEEFEDKANQIFRPLGGHVSVNLDGEIEGRSAD